MKLIIFVAICFMISSEVESGRLKVCRPKKKNKNNEDGEISLEDTFREMSTMPDNFHIDGPVPFNITSDVITASGYIKDTEISNYLNFTLCILDNLLEPFRISMNSLKIQGREYNITGDVGDLFDIFGNGPFEIDMEGFSIVVNNISFWSFKCFGVDVDVKLKNFKVNFENLMGGDEFLQTLLNKVIGDMGPDIVDYVWQQVYIPLIPSIQKFLDEHINKIELANLMDVYLRGGPSWKKFIGKCVDFPTPKIIGRF